MIRAELARLGVALELGVGATQALAAVWFYKLFGRLSPLAAGSLAAFALVNANTILMSAALLETAVAGDASLAPGRPRLAPTRTDDARHCRRILYDLYLLFVGIREVR